MLAYFENTRINTSQVILWHDFSTRILVRKSPDLTLIWHKTSQLIWAQNEILKLRQGALQLFVCQTSPISGAAIYF